MDGMFFRYLLPNLVTRKYVDFSENRGIYQ